MGICLPIKKIIWMTIYLGDILALGKADAVKWVAGVESLPATVQRVPSIKTHGKAKGDSGILHTADQGMQPFQPCW